MNTKDYSKILKEIPYRLYRKILYEFQRIRDSGKSLISFSIKSYMNKRGGRRSSRISLISFIEKSWLSFKGTVIVFFEDSGKSLIVFSEKSCGNPLLCFQKKVVAIRNGQGCPLKQKKSIFYRGQKYTLFLLFMNYSNTKYI